MREFNTKTTEGDYSITFETDDRKAFEQVQTLCRILVDGKDGEAIPIGWIDAYIKRRLKVADIYAAILYISDMLKEWKEENAEVSD